MRKLIIFGSAFRYPNTVDNIDGWEVYKNPAEEDPDFTRDPFSKAYTKIIKKIKPDFVIGLCAGCTEMKWDAMKKPKGPKYISWTHDSYRHAIRPITSDLHLSAIPDATMTRSDNYMPLWAESAVTPIPLNQRKIKVGICCRPYDCANSWRKHRLADLAVKNMKGMLYVNLNNIPLPQFTEELRTTQLSLNVPVYPDGLPNRRIFEAGANGVMPLVHADNRGAFAGLIDDAHIKYFDDNATPDTFRKSIGRGYDPLELQAYYNKHHTLGARLQTIFKEFFDISFPAGRADGTA